MLKNVQMSNIINPVSYTHLDVYKRQTTTPVAVAMNQLPHNTNFIVLELELKNICPIYNKSVAVVWLWKYKKKNVITHSNTIYNYTGSFWMI